MMESIIKDKCYATYIVTGRHDVTMTYVALMVNNGFIQEARGIVLSQKLQACQPNLTAVCKMMESIIKDKCVATYCDGTS